MACGNITLAGMAISCDSNVGGIKEVYITQYDNIDFDKMTETEGVITAIPFKEGATAAKWYAYHFRRGTGNMASSLTSDESTGISFVTTTIDLVFGRMETKKRIEMSNLSKAQVSAIVRDSNGKYWLVGKSDYCSASTGTGNTGTAKSDENAYRLTLQTEDADYPFEISEAAVKALPIVEPTA